LLFVFGENMLVGELRLKDSTLDYAPLNQIVGNYIKENSNPGDKIFVWGWGHGIYYFSNRGMGVRFMHCDVLSGRIPASNPKDYTLKEAEKNIPPDTWGMFLEDMEKNKPVYVLNTSPAKIHDYEFFPLGAYPILKDYVNKNYRLETIIEGVEIYRIKPQGDPAPTSGS
ncbi:MAG: hypothetical protein R3257_03435, partial [bacterium]|nr:hypothetical protein [bacterium]